MLSDNERGVPALLVAGAGDAVACLRGDELFFVLRGWGVIDR